MSALGYENNVNGSSDSSILGNYNTMNGNNSVIAGNGDNNTADSGAILDIGSTR
ncbi:MAG TPA: hypothetical protein VFA81_03425 [Burkholderiales bacterium]|nr:hypothetical protein [Burkholderiales bacterium]